MAQTAVTAFEVQRVQNGAVAAVEDLLVTEEPLEIRLGHGPLDAREEFRLSVTMRTPGHDAELATGFLLTEGIIAAASDLLRVEYCAQVKPEERGNVVRAELHPDVQLDPALHQRNFYTTSSCGVCGKSSIEAVHASCMRTLVRATPPTDAVVRALPDTMRAGQTMFKHTGGIHAAALFSAAGELLLLREDVGRHNAVDKVIGARLRSEVSADSVLMISGRAGFELVQKCIVSGIPSLVAIGAPSSLSVELARSNGLNLIGFLRGDRYNVYSGTCPR